MKRTFIASLLAIATLLPAGAFAQSTVTRAQVRAELGELQRAGYRGTTSDASYLSELLAAEQRVAARDTVGDRGNAHDNANGSYGSSTDGSSASGASTRTQRVSAKHASAWRALFPQEIPGLQPVYFGQ
jgi:hypothetical protein